MAAPAAGVRRFDLDPVGRVTAVHSAHWSERYTYDAAGNQSSAFWPELHPGQEATGPRSYCGTLIRRAGDVRFEHDAQGRMILRQKTRLSREADTWHYGWDAEDRLVSLKTPDGALWRYEYDALGRRITKKRLADDGQTVLEQVAFVWDGTTLCEEVSQGAAMLNVVTRTWDYDGVRPLAQTERIDTPDASQEAVDERFFAIVTDLVGTPNELIEESGDLSWRTRRTVWGTTAWAKNSSVYTPLRFPGQYFDRESLLHYNYLRYYEPGVCRYISSDPDPFIRNELARVPPDRDDN